jgi:hypothetical protein
VISDAQLWCRRGEWLLTIRCGAVIEHHSLVPTDPFGILPDPELEAKRRALAILRRYVPPSSGAAPVLCAPHARGRYA